MQMKRGYDISRRNGDYHIDIPRLRKGGVNLQVFASLANPHIEGKSEYEIVNEYIDCLKTEIAKNSGKVSLCMTADEAIQTKKDNKIGAVLAIEGGTVLGSDPKNLEYFYNKGVRLLTLIHEQSTDWSVSWSDKNPAFQGITDPGREIIGEMNRLGMIIDISHCAASSANEAIEASKFPVVASHSCAASICPSGRNLTDEQIKAIAAKGGVIGVTFVNFILSPELNGQSNDLREKYPVEIKRISELFVSTMPEKILQEKLKKISSFIEEYESSLNHLRPTVKTVVDHIEHIINQGGIDCVAIGSDFDGMSMPPIGLEDCSGMPNITKELLLRNYGENDIEKILGGNFMRIFKEVCG